MSLDVGTLYATLTIRDDGFQSGMSRAQSTAQQADRTIQGATRSTTALGTAGRTAGQQVAAGTQQAATGATGLTAALGKAKTAAGMLGIAFTAKAAVSFFTDAVQNSRALGAQTNQLTVLFGKNKQEIMDWGKTASKELFISQRAAQDAAIQFATFGTVAGKSGKNLANFSKDMTKLAVETASFGGTDVQSVIDAMGSAFQGQAIPMRKYGVLLSDTALRQTALKNGIIETNRVMSGSEKVQATEIALKEQLQAVNGDIERSHGQLGQNLKGLKARYEEVSAAIGDKLKPIVNSFVQLLSGAGLDALKSTASVIGIVAKGVMTLASAFGSLPGPIQALVAGMVLAKLGAGALGAAFAATQARVMGAVGSMTGAMAAMRGMASATNGVASAGRFGAVNMGSFGSSIAALGQKVPAVAKMQTAFLQAASGADNFARTRGTFAAATTGMKAGISGLTGALGGPFGIAIMAATIGLGQWMKKSAEAKAASTAMATASTNVAQELEKSGGHFSKAGEDAAAAALGTIKLSDGTSTLKDALDRSGVSAKDAARGLAGIGDAADKTLSQLEALHNTQRADMGFWEKMKQQVSNTFKGEEWDYETDAGRARDAYITAQEQIAEKRKNLVASFADESIGAEFEINADSHELNVMTDAMETFADASSGAADKVGALSKALDALNADDLTLENATQQLNDAVRDLPDEFKTAHEEAAKAGKSFLDASGHVNTFTKAGSKLHDTMQDTASGFGAVASATYENEFALGNYSGALDVTRAKLTEQYNAHVDQAVAAGRNREEYEALLASYGATPEAIMTRLDIVNAQASKDIMAAFGDQITGMPDAKTVTLTTLSDDARKKLESYGFEIEALPEGKGFKVVAETQQAENLLTGLKGTIESVPNKDVQVDAPRAPEVTAQLQLIADQVNSDNDKPITITDNSPAVIAALNSLNITTTTLADGTVVITDNASEVSSKINRELQGKRTTGTHVIEEIRTSRGGGGTFADGGFRAFAAGGFRSYAAGGFEKRAKGNLPGAAEIRSPQKDLVQWAEPETGGEAFIPLAMSKRARSTQILSETARRMGLAVVSREAAKVFKGDPKSLTNQTDPTGWRALLGGDYNPKLRRFGIEEDNPFVGAVLSIRNMITKGDYDGGLGNLGVEEDHPIVDRLLNFNRMLSFANGGFTPSVGGLDSLAQSFEGKGYSWGATGYETDCSGMQSALANYADGRDPFSSRTGTGGMDAFLKERGFKPGMGSKGALSIGWYNGGPYGGHTAGTLPNGVNVEMGGARGNGQYGGSAASAAGFPNIMHRVMADMVGIDFDETNDPDGMKALMQDGDFTGRFRKAYDVEEDDPLVDKLLEYRKAKLAGETFDGELTEENDPDGIKALMEKGDYTGRFRTAYGAEEDSKLVDGLLKARKNGYQKDTTATLKDATSATATSSGSVQDVYVTNWPGTQAAAAKEEERKPKFRIGFEMFEDGGMRLPQNAGIYPDGANLVRFAEKGTGGEAYIPLAPSKRARSQQIWRDTGAKLGMTEFLDGGFGGDHGSMPETAAVTLSSKAGIQAGGAGIVGLAGIAHLIANLTQGEFDMGSAPGLTEPIKKAVEDQMTALHKQILELTGRAEQLRRELREAEAAGDTVRADRIRAQLKMTDEEARAASDEYADLKTESDTAPRTSSGGSGARTSQRLSAQEQNVVDSIGSTGKGNGGDTYNFTIGQIANGPVTVNDPNDLMEHKTGDPIGDAMRAVGVR
ncbi:hypothetical protein RCF19_29765 [Rhodococcus qingshengii]